MLAGLARVRLMVDGQVRDLRTGLHEVKINILRLLSEQVCHVYQLPAGEEGAIATGARAIPDNVQLPCSMSVKILIIWFNKQKVVTDYAFKQS